MGYLLDYLLLQRQAIQRDHQPFVAAGDVDNIAEKPLALMRIVVVSSIRNGAGNKKDKSMHQVTSRREFLGGGAALLTALGWEGCVSVPDGEKTLPAWRPGMMDLHFIYTGRGENMFYRLPDGTSVLNDVGEFYRPSELKLGTVLLPSAERLGGDWVCRYLHRVYPEKEIDYTIFSHWHLDHVGHASWDRMEDPRGAFPWRKTPDGRRVNGFLCVAEDFRLRRCLDHQYPNRGMYGTHDSALELFEGWIRSAQASGTQVEPFRVGALDQIRLVRDPAAYAGKFSIRNVCANAVAWDGRNGTIDFGAEHVAAGGKALPQNTLSATFLITYGKFSYYASGDIQTQAFTRKDGSSVDYETHLGSLLGPVTVCKMGHHGCSNAMGDGLVRTVRADAYVSCMWCPWQASQPVLTRLAATPSHVTGARPLLLPQLMSPIQREWFETRKESLPFSAPAVHVVIRVPPGGESYHVYLLDARDEEMRVVAEFERKT